MQQLVNDACCKSKPVDLEFRIEGLGIRFGG